jgi:transposase
VPAHLVDAYPDLSVAEIAERAGVSYATAYRRVRESRGGELAPRVVWANRSHVVARSAESDARCVEAIRMRDAGAKWLEVALALGYSSEYHANAAVRRYRARGGGGVVTPLRTRAIEVLEEAIGEWSRRLVPDRYVDPPTLVEVQVDALLAAGLLHDPTCEARIERAARDLLMDALGAIYDLGGCDGTCGTTGQCVAKRIRAYLADDQEDTDA